MVQVLAEGLHPLAGAAAARAGARGQLGEDQRLHRHRPGEDQHRLQVRFVFSYYYYFYLLSSDPSLYTVSAEDEWTMYNGKDKTVIEQGTLEKRTEL